MMTEQVPGFAALDLGRSQLVSLAQTKTLGTSVVNELRLSFMRSANRRLALPIFINTINDLWPSWFFNLRACFQPVSRRQNSASGL